MTATPYPQNLYHSGAALPLELSGALTVPPSGDIVITVVGNASSQGWTAIPSGQKMVVTIGRATEYEAKYLVSSVSSGSTTSTLTVLAADRNYDGTVPVNAPSGTAVEHTISATEMDTINSHMRTKLAHGSDGELVDQNSAQTLTNKTLDGPIIQAPVFDSARIVPVGSILMWPSNTIPTGFLACNGQTITEEDYPDLFALVGATVPNLSDKFVKAGTVNLTAQQSHTRTLEVANLPSHKHNARITSATQAPHNHGGATFQDGIHSHTFSSSGTGSVQTYGGVTTYENVQGGGSRTILGFNPFTLNGIAHSHGVTGTIQNSSSHAHGIASATPVLTVTATDDNVGSAQPFNIEPQHVVLQYIICAEGQGA